MSKLRPVTASAIVVLLSAALTACGPGTTPPPSASPTTTVDPTETATPDPTTSSTPTTEPEPEPAPSLDASDRENIRAAIESGNTAAIEAYFASPVNAVIMSSECCGDLFPSEAVEALSYVTGAPGPWNWSVSASTIAEWRANYYYGSLFTGDDITGVAADGTVVSFGIVGDRITTLLMGFEEGFTF